MKITIICDVLGEPNNGTTIAAYNLIDYLKEKGHDVTVVSPDKSTKGKDGYMVVPTINLGKIINKIIEKNDVCLAKGDLRVLTEAIKDADVVHFLIPFPLAWTGIKVALKHNKPITASFHCQAENFSAHIGLMDSKCFNHLIYKFFYKKVYRYCDAIHYPTQFIKDTFEEHIKKETPAIIISNGVNDIFYQDVEGEKYDKFTIMCTGRLCKEKGQKVLIKALKKSKYKDNIHVVFAGKGPDKKKLVRLARRSRVDCEFDFYKREDLVKKLKGANLYVHTATAEIEAISCTEAIVCGLVPVICDSKESATRYFAINKENLFKKKSVKDLRSKIEYFYENPSIVLKNKEDYRNMAHSFSQKECMAKMERMIIDVVDKKRA